MQVRNGSLDTIAEGTPALAWCAVHRSHSPHNETVEWHHLVPVAWQLHTPLPPNVVPPSPGADTDGRGMLWDNRGVWLCPTGHRNIHYWIVKLMHEIAALGVDDVMAAEKVVRPHTPPAEFPDAVLGLKRLLAVQGSLLALTKQGEWGQI